MGLAVFHLWTGVFGLLPSPQQRAIHVGLGVALVFLVYPARKAGGRTSVHWWDLLLVGLILTSSVNIVVNWLRYTSIRYIPATPLELALAVAGIVATLEAGRRTVGWVFPAITALAVAYALQGQYIPGEFGHAPMRASVVLAMIYLTNLGMWGFMTGIGATYVALFIIFGAILLGTGGGKTFVDLAILAAGRMRGGLAKAAVLSSGFFATMSGSVMANVATTGTFTIPLMKKSGYPPSFAGAVEAVASTGGIVTPPIMGAAAFIMAEVLGISYLSVVIAAAIPAFLFYVSVFMGVHFEAVKRNLLPVRHEELPAVKSVFTLSRMVSLFFPIAILVYMLLRGYSLIVVSTSACLAALLTYILRDLSLRGLKERLWSIPQILEGAGRAVLGVVPLFVCGSTIIFLFDYTGLGLKFSQMVISLGADHRLLTLSMTAILLLILGCGLPVTAAYILGITVAAPLLIHWEILPLAAHLFILYYALLATITPPMCPAVFLGAHLAGSNWLKTAGVALKLAPLLYFLPFLFISDNSFIMVGSPWAILVNVSTAAAGAVVLASGAMGQLLTKCNIGVSLLLVASGILLLIPGWQTDLLGAALASAVLAAQLRQKRKGGGRAKTV